jgi:cytochrome c peroxidase
MHRTTLSLLLLLAPAACFSETPSSGDDSDGATSGDSEDSASDSEDGSSGDDADDSASGSSGADSDDSDSTTGADDGYPEEVTEVLDLPWPPDNYADPDLPDHFLTAPVTDLLNTPADNPVTDTGATLGRVLFYDMNLSANGTIACASCHKQSEGFSDQRAFSLGFEGGETGRNSMSLLNAAYYDNGHFFWDERADTLEDQVLMPIQDPVEMGMTLEGLVEAVDAQAYYGPLFEQAFGDDEVTSERISFALAQFVRAMVSTGSRYDDGLEMMGDPIADFPNFSTEENLGKQLFFSPQGNCAICHVGDPQGAPMPGQQRNFAVFQPLIAINNGLDANPEDEGAGDGTFKSHSLRNIALTGPYMHDGRFTTLLEVVEHYDNGVQAGPTTDPRLMPGGQPQNLGLTNPEKAAIVAFLETLTDEVIMDDPRFSDPFR